MHYNSPPLDNQRGPIRAASGKYWSKKYWTDHRLYMNPPRKSKWTGERGGYSTDTLTPLDEVVAPQLASLPYSVQGLLRPEFWFRLEGAQGWNAKFEAQAWLAGAVTEFSDAHLDIAYDYEEIELRARRCAEICEHIPTYGGLHAYTRSKNIDLPEPKGRITIGGCKSRARDRRWWRRKLTRLYKRTAETKLRAAGFIRRRRSLYASSFACAARRSAAAATRRFLERRACVSASGVQLNLWEVHQRSLSNPAIRRAELMTRLKGFENIATEMGHVAEFITATCPSEYHAINADGRANPSYRGHSVREGQAFLNRIWQKARAKLKRLSILIYGFRIAEPHHDGTPHWHMVLFTSSSDRDTLRTVLQEYWLSECGGERGAQDHRIKFKSIDTAKGSACGYLAKYIAKNIDGHEVGEDFEADDTGRETHSAGWDSDTGTGRRSDHAAQSAEAAAPSDATNTVQRVGAWASLHGIRQFQQIGGPQVTIYRELRRIRPEQQRVVAGVRRNGQGDIEEHRRSPAHVAPLERARVCADAGDWGGFIASNGGIAAGRQGALSLWKEVTGECNGYSELKGPQIVGVVAPVDRVRTRVEMWRIVKVGSFLEVFSDLGPVTIIVRGAPALAEPRGWTNPHETSMYGPLN